MASSSSSSSAKEQHKLADFAVDLLLFGLQLRRGQAELPAFGSVRRRVLLMIETFVDKSLRAGIAHGDIEDAKYALAAYVDEMVQYSDWGGRGEWAQLPLQAEIFGESRAGRAFFERLEQLRARHSPALQVYCNCLALGFQGEYRFGGDVDHDRLTEDIARDISRAKSRTLSPHVRCPADRADSGRQIPLTPLAAICLLLTVVSIVALYGILIWQSNSAVDLLQEMVRR